MTAPRTVTLTDAQLGPVCDAIRARLDTALSHADVTALRDVLDVLTRPERRESPRKGRPGSTLELLIDCDLAEDPRP